jgi:hypothetical protein
MRPLKESTPAEKVAENRHAIRQLQRRPAPVSEGAAGDVPWIVLKDIATGQAFGPDTDTRILYEEVVNDYPSTFDTTLFGSDIDGVEVLEAGIYSFHLHIFFDELNVAEHTISLLSPDPAAGPTYDREYYCPNQSATGVGVTGGSSVHDEIRLASGQVLKFNFNNTHPTNTYNAYDDGGIFLEVRKLGSATTNGRQRDIAT